MQLAKKKKTIEPQPEAQGATSSRRILMIDSRRARFLSNGLAGKDETRTYMQHYIARDGRAMATNGHVMYFIPHTQTTLGDVYQSFDCDKGVERDADEIVPNCDAVIADTHERGRERVLLDDKAVMTLRLACAAAIGASEEMERRWKREPKKTRAAVATDVGVRLVADDFGLFVVIKSFEKDTLFMRQKLDVSGTARFEVEVDPSYLIDALDALEEWALDRIVASVMTGKNGYMSPVVLTHDVGDLGASILIMPRRIK